MNTHTEKASKHTGKYPGQIHGYIRNGESLSIDEEKCTACGKCLEVCPHGVLDRTGPGAKVTVKNRAYCMECGACRMNCPFGAIGVESGVGCVAAIVSGMIRGTEPSCDCSTGSKKGGCC